jgi:predicted DNA-binding antitoxin AbrB/MazE fold protein
VSANQESVCFVSLRVFSRFPKTAKLELRLHVTSQQIDAIFDGGGLKPLVPLLLPDKTRVRLTVSDRVEDSSTIEPRDDWDRSLLAAGQDCGISLSNVAVSSEGLYE